jgi:hypothetical protein
MKPDNRTSQEADHAIRQSNHNAGADLDDCASAASFYSGALRLAALSPCATFIRCIAPISPAAAANVEPRQQRLKLLLIRGGNADEEQDAAAVARAAL